MSSLEDNFTNRQAKALGECRSSIEWYNKHKKTSMALYMTSQIATIVLSALTPVLILITDLPKWLQALPAALAAIAVSLSNVFHWQEHWIQRASALEALEAELVKYETRTSSAYDITLDKHQALNNFVENVTNLNLNEASTWRKVQGNKPDNR